MVCPCLVSKRRQSSASFPLPGFVPHETKNHLSVFKFHFYFFAHVGRRANRRRRVVCNQRRTVKLK
jgi:hypothetical protein